MSPKPELVRLASAAEVRSVTSWVNAVRKTDVGNLAEAYLSMRKAAPKRYDRLPPKSYFVGHSGIPSTGVKTNRLEEHLAIALWALDTRLTVAGDTVELLDYQVPMKARQTDAGIGKIDLFGLLDDGSAVVVELKVASREGRKSDTPLRALLEALTYAAIVEANLNAFGVEIDGQFGRDLADRQPVILIAAPSDYWSQWDGPASSNRWRTSLCRLATQVSEAIGVRILAWDLGEIAVEPGLNQTHPVLIGDMSPRPIC